MAASSSGDESGEQLFFDELETFEIQIPGGQKTSFGETEKMLEILHWQCPNWKEEGKISSVPIARVPNQSFLKMIHIPSDLHKSLKDSEKGESAEAKVYELFMHLPQDLKEGMIVFPNVNGRETFRTVKAHVEIDMVVAHPTKGFFIFNIKCLQKSAASEVKKDIEPHCGFIRMLIQYGQENAVDSIPMHLVICQLHDDKIDKFDKLRFSGNRSQTLIFGKKDLTQEAFHKKWKDCLSNLPLPVIPEAHRKEFDVSVARLVAVNSCKSTAAIIHDNMQSNFMQSFKKSKPQFDKLNTDKETKVLLEDTSRSKMGDKTKFILWTEEQLKVISFVVEHLLNPEEKGYLRLFVAGCKGSGKTMLLVFIAKIAAKLLQTEFESKVIVFNGGPNNDPLLSTELLKQLLGSSNVCDWPPQGEVTTGESIWYHNVY